MTLEQESYYQQRLHNNILLHSMGSIKGRAGSFPSAIGTGMETVATGPGGSSSGSRRQGGMPTSRENGQSSRYQTQSQSQYYRGSMEDYSNGTSCSGRQGGTSTPTKSTRKHTGAHRSQSARVVGSSRPKVKKREGILRDYQQHLDLASSEGALRDCQDSYNPFLSKVPSSGRLITSTSGEMSNSSLYSTPPPQLPQPIPLSPLALNQQFQNLQQNSSTPPTRDSPKFSRRQSTAFESRRGSDKSTPEKDNYNRKPSAAAIIPIIKTTPENSPTTIRRASSYNNKPTGLPRSPQTTRSGTSGTGSSARRVNSMKVRRNTGYLLDVPDSSNQSSAQQQDEEDEESYRLRSFTTTPKGIVNRGDSFRRRRSRSNSLVPTPATTPELQRNTTFASSDDGLLLPNLVADSNSNNPSRKSPMPSPKTPVRPFPKTEVGNGMELVNGVNGSGNRESNSNGGDIEHDALINHRVAMIGARGVGKAALVSQFMTSECINAYDRQNDTEGEETVCVLLNGEESELTFYNMNNPKTELNRTDLPDAFVILYSVVDRSSFTKAETELKRLQEWDLIRNRAVVLVGNKIDLVRTRAVSTQDGRCLAVSFRVKFIEVSVGINHNVDELLVGLLHQIRLKQAQAGNHESWCKHRGILRASVKARQMLTWLLGKEDAKFKNCENLHIL